MKKNLFFGGTFDPPHVGHDRVIEFLTGDPFVEKIFVVPNFQNPLKESVASLALRRKKWCELWLSKYKNSPVPVQLETFELDSAKPSYTIESLNFLKKREGGEWVLVIGSDILPTLHKWKNVESLLKTLSGLWILERPSVPAGALNHLKNEWKDLCDVRIIQGDFFDVSSSFLREKLSRGESIQDYLPEHMKNLDL